MLSVNSLLFELVADDYHLQIRSEKPDNYPPRFRIPIDSANWHASATAYQPPYYVSEEVLANDRLKVKGENADPEEKWEYENFIDWGRAFTRDETGKPLNPIGRTGIQGRGNLWLWGSNPMLMVIPIRYNPEVQSLELLISSGEQSLEIISSHFRRGEDPQTAFQRVKEKIGYISNFQQTTVHEGYLYDPRQTDHAWIDTQAILLFWSQEEDTEEIEEETGKVWKELNHVMINNLYSSHGTIVRKALKFMYEESWVKEEFIYHIIEKTG